MISHPPKRILDNDRRIAAYAQFQKEDMLSLVTAQKFCIALGGGVSAAGPFLRDAVREEVAKNVFCKEVPYARIELAVLGNDAGIIGAAMLGR